MGTVDLTNLKLYSDSVWAGLHFTTWDISSRRGGLITYGAVPIDWWSTKQPSIVTRSVSAAVAVAVACFRSFSLSSLSR